MLHVFTQKISFYISAYAGTFFIIQLVAHVPNGFWTHNLTSIFLLQWAMSIEHFVASSNSTSLEILI